MHHDAFGGRIGHVRVVHHAVDIAGALEGADVFVLIVATSSSSPSTSDADAGEEEWYVRGGGRIEDVGDSFFGGAHGEVEEMKPKDIFPIFPFFDCGKIDAAPHTHYQ